MASVSNSATMTLMLAIQPAPPGRDIHCRFLFIGATVVDTSWNPPLCNPFWRLYFNHEDGVSVRTPTMSWDLHAGGIHLVPPWGRFQGHCSAPVRHFFVHFDPLGLAGEWSRGSLDRPITLPRDPARDGLARELAETFSGTTCWRIRVQALVLDALAVALGSLAPEVLERLEHQFASHDPVAPALLHVEEHIHGSLPIPELAKVCDLSVDHFTKVFRQRIGQTPTSYIQERRVAMAAERLVTGDDPIDVIARSCGFANRFHFTRVFSRWMGIPPATYRRTGRV